MTANFEESIIEAIEKENIEEINIALSNGVDINMKDQYGQSLLVLAASKGNKEIVKLLISKGALKPEDWSWVKIYSCCGMKEEVENEIKQGIDLNVTDDGGWTELMGILLYTPNEQLEIVKMLVEKGADINIKSQSGNTALLVAVGRGFLKTAEFLIQKGADINAADYDNGWDAAYNAVVDEQAEILEMLFKNGADVNKIYNTFQMGSVSLLNVAYERELTDIISILKKYGAKEDVL